MELPLARMSMVSVLFTNVLLGTGAAHSRCRWVNQALLAAIASADDLCHPFWPGQTQQLPWESMWIGGPSLKVLRKEDMHSVVQSRPLLKKDIQFLYQMCEGLQCSSYIW